MWKPQNTLVQLFSGWPQQAQTMSHPVPYVTCDSSLTADGICRNNRLVEKFLVGSVCKDRILNSSDSEPETKLRLDAYRDKYCCAPKCAKSVTLYRFKRSETCRLAKDNGRIKMTNFTYLGGLLHHASPSNILTPTLCCNVETSGRCYSRTHVAGAQFTREQAAIVGVGRGRRRM